METLKARKYQYQFFNRFPVFQHVKRLVFESFSKKTEAIIKISTEKLKMARNLVVPFQESPAPFTGGLVLWQYILNLRKAKKIHTTPSAVGWRLQMVPSVSPCFNFASWCLMGDWKLEKIKHFPKSFPEMVHWAINLAPCCTHCMARNRDVQKDSFTIPIASTKCW